MTIGFLAMVVLGGLTGMALGYLDTIIKGFLASL